MNVNTTETEFTASNSKNITVFDPPPIITSIQAVPDFANATTTITWNTDEQANGTIEYGTTIDLGTTSTNNTTTTNHTITLTNLTRETLYHYNITSCDQPGNCNTTGPNTFTIPDLTMTLTPTPNPVQRNTTLTVRGVVNLTNGSAVAGATVSITLNGTEKTNTTNATGGYVVSMTSPFTLTTYNLTGNTTHQGVPANASETLTVTDGIAPVITEENATNTQTTTTDIVWTTDEVSNSSVQYGTTPAMGSKKSENSTVTGHNITLTSLTPGTVYQYNVTSCDPTGNCNTTGTFNFTTEKPPSITNLQENVSLVNATISWITDEQANSTVEYGTTQNLGVLLTNATFSANHTFTLTELSHGTTYFYNITVCDTQAFCNTTARTFTTIGLNSTILLNQTLVERGQNISVSGIVNLSNGSQVIGVTVEVFVNRTPQVNTTTNDSGSYTVSFLVPTTLGDHEARVNITYLGATTSAAQTFTVVDTLPPTPTNISVKDITNETVRVTWTTGEPTNGTVLYGVTTAYGKNASNVTLTLQHTVLLVGLTARTTYFFNLTTCDDNNNCGTAGPNNFSTTGLLSIENVTNATSFRDATVTITWNTNEATNSTLAYGTTEVLGTQSTNNSLSTVHGAHITGIERGQQYYYNITACDDLGCNTTGPFKFIIPTLNVSITLQQNTSDINQNITLSGEVNLSNGTPVSGNLSITIDDTTYLLNETINFISLEGNTTPSTNATGKFSFLFNLQTPGTHIIEVNSTYENVTASANTTFIVANSPPVITNATLAPSPEATIADQLLVAVTCEDDNDGQQIRAYVELYKNNNNQTSLATSKTVTTGAHTLIQTADPLHTLNDTWYARARCDDGTNTTAWVTTENTTIIAPSASTPIPFRPANGSIVVYTNLSFAWLASTNNLTNTSVTYHLQLSQNENFTQIELNVTNITGTEYVNHSFRNGTFWWRIRSFNELTYSNWSNVSTVTVLGPVLNITTPSAGAILDQGESTSITIQETAEGYWITNVTLQFLDGASDPTVQPVFSGGVWQYNYTAPAISPREITLYAFGRNGTGATINTTSTILIRRPSGPDTGKPTILSFYPNRTNNPPNATVNIFLDVRPDNIINTTTTNVTLVNGSVITLTPTTTSTTGLNKTYNYTFTPNANGTYLVTTNVQDVNNESSTIRFNLTVQPETAFAISTPTGTLTLRDPKSDALIANGTSITRNLTAGTYTAVLDADPVTVTATNTPLSPGTTSLVNFTNLPETITPPTDRRSIETFQLEAIPGYDLITVVFNYSNYNASITSEDNLELYTCPKVTGCELTKITNFTINTTAKTITYNRTNLSVFMIAEPTNTITTIVTTSTGGGGGGGGGGATVSERIVQLELAVRGTATMHSNDVITLPLSVRNPGDVTLQNISLTSRPDDGLSSRLSKQVIPILKPGDAESVILTVESFNRTGVLSVILTATSKHPAVTDRATVVVDVRTRKTKLAKTSPQEDITFAREILSENKECRELESLLTTAEELLNQGEIERAAKFARSALDGCKRILSLIGKEPVLEQPRPFQSRMFAYAVIAGAITLTLAILTFFIPPEKKGSLRKRLMRFFK